MDRSTIISEALNNAAFVEQELENFLLYYKLKHTLRWGSTDPVTNERESVAEHVYGMHILNEYFLHLHEEMNLNPERVIRLINWHDMGEAITTDMPANTKTDAHRELELAAETTIHESAGTHMRSTLESVFAEYNAQETKESRYVKALDKIEPMFQMYFIVKNPDTTEKNMGWQADDYRTFRQEYIREFPLLLAFDNVIDSLIFDSGFFPPQ